MRNLKFIVKTVLLSVVLGFLLLTDSYLQAYYPRVSINEIEMSDVPTELEDIKIVFLSDVHYGPSRDGEWLDMIVNMINAQKPDLVLLGGDYVEYHASYVDPVIEKLAQIRAPLGLCAVMGNHDYFRGADLMPAAMEKYGIKLLDNKNEYIKLNNGGFWLAGVADPIYGRPDYNAARNGIDEDDFMVLLSHGPDQVIELPDSLPDLVLSGHTHGGQITLFGKWAPYVPSKYGNKYLSGLFDIKDIKLLVSNGVGTFRFPFRWFAPAEMHVISLKNKS